MTDPLHTTDAASAGGRISNVHELTLRIKELLEGDLSDVAVQGEVSGVRLSANGHLYFTLKDDRSLLACVIWRGSLARIRAQGIEIREGSSLVLEGGIQVYAPRGAYQLVVESVSATGSGALFEAFERLKRKLQAEGLFDAGRKRPVPSHPLCIGVVTSSSGAAFRDIAATLERRWPVAKILLCHASVQGPSAPPELIQALRTLNRRRDVDVIILGRGGGSIEDLWAFNDEHLARAIAESPIPVISAVGHEIDICITDYVADLTAATPTQAAVKATPDIRDVRMRFSDLGDAVGQAASASMERRRQRVRTLTDSYAIRALRDRLATSRERWMRLAGRLDLQADRIQGASGRILELRRRLDEGVRRRVERSSHLASHLSIRLDTLNPDTPLRRGYVRVMQNGAWVRSRRTFDTDAGARLIWGDGEADLTPR